VAGLGGARVRDELGEGWQADRRRAIIFSFANPRAALVEPFVGSAIWGSVAFLQGGERLLAHAFGRGRSFLLGPAQLATWILLVIFKHAIASIEKTAK
jgi:hypothetical protein